jgi:hypothetical protein
MRPQRHASDDQLDAVTWCRHLVSDGSVYAFLADHRHQLFPAELVADVSRHGGGHPSVPAEVIATVMVLRALEGLGDREAISALRRDIAWKVACGLREDQTVTLHARTRMALAWSRWLVTVRCCAVLLAVIRSLMLAVVADAVSWMVFLLGDATIGLIVTLRRPTNPTGCRAVPTTVVG